jgi:hypothetical protein
VESQAVPALRANAEPGPEHKPLNGATTVPDSNDSATPKSRRARRAPDAPIPDAPGDVMAVLRHGGTAALACAAASSAVSLYWLAILVGWPAALAWLLPASLDVYAGTSLYVGYRLPARHPAAKTARRNARFALSLSVASNAIYHALVLFGSAWPVWVHDSLLVAVSALPPVVVERLLHLRSKVGNGVAATPVPATATVSAATTATPAPVARPATPPAPSVSAMPATPVTATPPARRPAATGNSAIRLITSTEKEAIVEKLLAEHGDDMSLTLIADAIGTKHRATAMKVRDRVIKARPEPKPGDEDPAEEPEPALGAAS